MLLLHPDSERVHRRTLQCCMSESLTSKHKQQFCAEGPQCSRLSLICSRDSSSFF